MDFQVYFLEIKKKNDIYKNDKNYSWGLNHFTLVKTQKPRGNVQAHAQVIRIHE